MPKGTAHEEGVSRAARRRRHNPFADEYDDKPSLRGRAKRNALSKNKGAGAELQETADKAGEESPLRKLTVTGSAERKQSPTKVEQKEAEQSLERFWDENAAVYHHY